ncbi:MULTISPECIES: YcjF family protein [Methylosinus]|uniref:TIGR01620 family protein n=1 Tax=Methylosinus trichosporium (strain ATCC 35070 / NCIMB 11131 / UNIQEM 75 / OB3b) TaxID=595536 RepID=A0A2D2D5A6_METT3|nr:MULTISPECIES: TIGR01620 family protein [Methylosinus]ATQ70156.1 TIGR01620 family protein [Methylosinus trichosporium OB3b]OBS53406.1 TIGR01620 family protein [Methylosinus sp. 3S-1]
MSEAERRPRPRAFRLEGEQIVPPKSARPQEPERAPATSFIEPQADIFSLELDETRDPAEQEKAVEAAQKSGVLSSLLFSWGGLLASSVLGLVTMAAGLWLTNLVEDLFAHSALFGTIGLTLAAIAVVALVALLTRESFAILRQNRIAQLHLALAEARSRDDVKAARERVVELCKLYEDRPESGRARALVIEFSKEIIDGSDLVDLAERHLVLPLDALARREIADASKRVSIVTTISPRALLDVLFVAAQAIRLMRRIAEIYGGRPGLLGFFKLARSVGAHLAITGGLAIGDSLLQQVVGHGLAAKLSAKLGEGVLNGLLTARVGLSAMAVCRPMPFCAEKPPGVADVAPFLFGDKTKG